MQNQKIKDQFECNYCLKCIFPSLKMIWIKVCVIISFIEIDFRWHTIIQMICSVRKRFWLRNAAIQSSNYHNFVVHLLFHINLIESFAIFQDKKVQNALWFKRRTQNKWINDVSFVLWLHEMRFWYTSKTNTKTFRIKLHCSLKNCFELQIFCATIWFGIC